MFNINTVISLLLLIGRLVGIYLMLRVLMIQLSLRKRKDHVSNLRAVLMSLGIVIMLGNVIPVIIDVMGIFGKGSYGLLVAYAFSNNLTAVLAAFMILKIYKVGNE